MFAIQVDGLAVQTVEGLTSSDALGLVQQGFAAEHGLQCGFCTPGFLMTVTDLLERIPHPSDEQIRHELSGNICRCTGYVNIVRAVRWAADRLSPSAEIATSGDSSETA
jgi:carbon-monoxide dehydrogenase small subunit